MLRSVRVLVVFAAGLIARGGIAAPNANNIVPGPNLPGGMELVLATKFLESPPEFPSMASEGYYLWEGQTAGRVLLCPEGRGVRTPFEPGDPAGAAPDNSRMSINDIGGVLLPTVGPGQKQYITWLTRHSTNYADGAGDPGVDDNWTAGTKEFFFYSSAREDVNNIVSYGTVGRAGHNPGVVSLFELPNGGGAFIPASIERTTAEIQNGLYKRIEMEFTYPSGPGIADGQVRLAWDGGTWVTSDPVRFEEAGSSVQWFMDGILSVKTYGGAPVGHPGPPEAMYIDNKDIMVYNEAA